MYVSLNVLLCFSRLFITINEPDLNYAEHEDRQTAIEGPCIRENNPLFIVQELKRKDILAHIHLLMCRWLLLMSIYLLVYSVR